MLDNFFGKGRHIPQKKPAVTLKEVKALKSQFEQLELIINSLSAGLIAVDNSLKVSVINPFAREIFELSKESYAGENIEELIKDTSICKLIKKTIHEDSSFSEEYKLKKISKTIKITASPIKSSENVMGAALFIQDITHLEQVGSEFVSNVTHELKTPLTSIRGFIETLRTGAINDPEVAHKFLDIIDIEAERLFNLINDILALSEIETMKHDVDMTSFMLENVVSDTINILQGQAEKKNISINTDIEPDLKIRANRYRIIQLVLNLVDNSIKYSHEGSWILIKAYREEKNVVISFKDSGIGIPGEHLSRIFDRFYRVDKGRSRSLGGTGLGLSIVKYITGLYNGDVKVFSKPGKGTEFVVTFRC